MKCCLFALALLPARADRAQRRRLHLYPGASKGFLNQKSAGILMETADDGVTSGKAVS
jgi:hypothetical protein